MISDINRITTLKTIAEVLNQSYEREVMLQTVLDSFLDITHFEAGWIFLGEEEMHLAADSGLPEALSVNHKQPMCGSDSCYCLSRYQQQRLNEAINIITCKRLEEAIEHGQYDTGGFTHHATVPLQNEHNRYGVFNVTAPNRNQFEQSELDLLQSIAEQMTYALERIELYEDEEKRSRYLQKLHTFTTSLRAIEQLEDLVPFIRENLLSEFEIIGCEVETENIHFTVGEISAHQYNCPMSQVSGKIIFYNQIPLQSVEKEVLSLVRQHIELTIKDLLIKEREKEMIQLQERETLAQDLHDTVNQLLYSITATASALDVMNQDNQLNEPINDLNQLSKQALQEMRELIENKKNSELKMGLKNALKQYAQQLNLELDFHTEGTSLIPPYIEETLYKIGREGLHNIYKHAGVNKAQINLRRQMDSVSFTISDQGVGFEGIPNQKQFGLNGMQQRVNYLDGDIDIQSKKGEGVSITIRIPIKRR